LLLRRFVDQTEIDEVFVVDEKTKYGLEDLLQEKTEKTEKTDSPPTPATAEGTD
jgi:hypothetical protein